jgi:tetratricopeptide (TPR) repeat protein
MLPNGDPKTAFDTLQDRHLVEYAPTLPPSHSPTPLIRQHNLIRSIAYDLLKTDRSTWEAAERQAAHLWLTAYHPAPDAPHLETVRGYLEAFDHYCEVGDWEAAKHIAWTRLDTPTHEYLCLQLGTWGCFQEQTCLHRRQLDVARKMNDVQEIGCALCNLGNAYYSLGQYEQAIDYHQQHLTIAREIGDRWGQGAALGNLGNVYDNLGQYEWATEFYQQCLTIARETDNRRGEGNALGSLGLIYNSLGEYEWTIDYHQQHLSIAREIGDRRGEGAALVNIGATQLKLKQYPDSLRNNQIALEIFREIGDRTNEAEALKNLAELHQALGELGVARQYGQQALALSTELGISLKAECEALMAELGKG